MTPGLLSAVVAALRAAHIRLALVGAGALASHGISRSTFDLDLFTTDPAALDASTWVDLSEHTRANVDIRCGDGDDPLRGVVRVTGAGERDVDVVVGRSKWQADVVDRARPIDIGGLSIPVVEPADLVLLKLYAGGPQDLWDIQQLLARDDRSEIVESVEGRIVSLPKDCGQRWSTLVR